MQACLITLVRGEKYKISGGGASLARDMIERETERKGRERGRGRLKALDCTRSAGCGWDRIGWQAGTHHFRVCSVLVSDRDGNVLLDFSCPCVCHSNMNPSF